MKIKIFVKETRSYIVEFPELQKGETPNLIEYFQGFKTLSPEEREQFFEELGSSELLLTWEEG